MEHGDSGAVTMIVLRVVGREIRIDKEYVTIHLNLMEDVSVADKIIKRNSATPIPVQVLLF